MYSSIFDDDRNGEISKPKSGDRQCVCVGVCDGSVIMETITVSVWFEVIWANRIDWLTGFICTSRFLICIRVIDDNSTAKKSIEIIFNYFLFPQEKALL